MDLILSACGRLVPRLSVGPGVVICSATLLIVSRLPSTRCVLHTKTTLRTYTDNDHHGRVTHGPRRHFVSLVSGLCCVIECCVTCIVLLYLCVCFICCPCFLMMTGWLGGFRPPTHWVGSMYSYLIYD